MSKFTCTCGWVLNLSNGWADSELLLLSEKIIDGVAERIESGQLDSSEGFYAAIDKAGVGVYRCPSCDRLHLETEANVFVSYVKE